MKKERKIQIRNFKTHRKDVYLVVLRVDGRLVRESCRGFEGARGAAGRQNCTRVYPRRLVLAVGKNSNSVEKI